MKTDDQKKGKRLEQLKGWRDQELYRQGANRAQMALDEDFYDGLQWDAKEAAEVASRGQAPVVYNQTKPTIDWLIGTERRMRTDYKIAPVGGKPIELDIAQGKQKLMKYIGEQNRSTFVRSSAFKDAIKAGVGWREIGVRGDPEDEPIYLRHDSWRNNLHDSLSVDPDYTDARYHIRRKSVDLDIAIAYFPEKEDELTQSAEANTGHIGFDWWFGRRLSDLENDPTLTLPSRFQVYDSAAWLFNPRERIFLDEAWYYAPSTKTTKAGTGTYDRTKMVLWCTIFTDSHIIHEVEQPYKHNRIPFVPTWCYRRARDNAPYGVIRNLRGPQEAHNKRQSKALFAVSANQATIEKGAIDKPSMDLEEIREELSAPDGIVVLDDGGIQKFRREKNIDVAQAHLAMADRDQLAIREVGGVTSENLGRDTNLVSGIALERKQQQGQQVTAEVFDNLRMADQIVGEQVLALAEEFYTAPKVFRVTGQRSRHEFVSINTRDESTGEVINPISAFKSQFVIDEQDYRASMRQAMFEELMNLMDKIAKVNPQFAMNTMDIVLEYADVQGREVLIKRIRELNGQRDPEEPMTPVEEQAKNAAKAMADQSAKAQLDLLLAKIEDLKASAAAKQDKSVLDAITALYTSLQAAQVVASVPGAGPVADEIAKAAGFQDRGGQDPNIPAIAQPMPPVPVPMQTDGAQVGAQQGIETVAPDGVVQ